MLEIGLSSSSLRSGTILFSERAMDHRANKRQRPATQMTANSIEMVMLKGHCLKTGNFIIDIPPLVQSLTCRLLPSHLSSPVFSKGVSLENRSERSLVPAWFRDDRTADCHCHH